MQTLIKELSFGVGTPKGPMMQCLLTCDAPRGCNTSGGSQQIIIPMQILLEHTIFLYVHTSFCVFFFLTNLN